MKLLKLTRKHPPFNAGEVASFPPHIAKALLRSGVAVDPSAAKPSHKMILAPPPKPEPEAVEKEPKPKPKPRRRTSRRRTKKKSE